MNAQSKLLQTVNHLLRRLNHSHSFATLFFTCLIVLCTYITPHRSLNDNEEHYFAIAETFYDHNAPTPQRERGNLNHTPLFGLITGFSVSNFGFETTQMLGRILIILLFSLALTRFAKTFQLSSVDLLLLLIIFWLYGQYIIGEEWLFDGYEPKTLAYPFLIFALTESISLRLGRATGWLIVASYFHIQIGAYWFAFVMLFALLQGCNVKSLFKYATIYAIAISPLFTYLLLNHYDLYSGNTTQSLPSANEIFSLYRFPHHVSPFSDLWNFIHWAPDIARLTAITLICLALYIFRKGTEKNLAMLNLIVLCFLLFALALSAIDHHTGYLGPLLLFRPSSIALLLFITQIILYIKNTQPLEQSFAILSSMLLFFLLWAGPIVARYQLEIIENDRHDLSDQAPLYDYIAHRTSPDDIFLIATDIENRFLGFERQTHRSAFVLYKFIPTSKSGILDWYQRTTIQKEFTKNGCLQKMDYKINYLILNNRANNNLASACGESVFTSQEFILIKAKSETQQPTTHGTK